MPKANMKISTTLVNHAMKLRPIFPWLSLAFGLTSAFFMDRSGNHAWVMIALSLLGFLLVIALSLVQRIPSTPAEQSETKQMRRAKWQNIGHTGAIFATQSIVQNCLLFSFPFYALAALLDVWHALFLLIFGVLVGLSLWDPIYAKTARGFPIGIFFMQSFAALFTLNTVLPQAGLSNKMSLWVSMALVSVLSALLVSFLYLNGKFSILKTALTTLILSSLMFLALFGGAARLIPAAPYRILYGGLGSALGHRKIVDDAEDPIVDPQQLVCASIISAPKDIKDQLFHVWHVNGKQSDRIRLEIKGSEKKGFFTYSRKRNFAKAQKTRVSCSVVSETGQLLFRERKDLVLSR